jgi:hypothetical protein
VTVTRRKKKGRSRRGLTGGEGGGQKVKGEAVEIGSGRGRDGASQSEQPARAVSAATPSLTAYRA